MTVQKMRYFDECKWRDAGDGMLFDFIDHDGEKLAEISLFNFDAKLWKFDVLLPEKFQLEGRSPSGLVYSAAAAKRVVETILLNTIVVRS